MRYPHPLSVFLPVLLITLCAQGARALPTQLDSPSVLSGERIEIGQGKSKKGLVVVFLSASCPCSDSHIVEIKNLHEQYSDYEFVGIHSNTDETQEQAVEYFSKLELPFPVLRDTGARLADEFKALKTPHAFVVLPDGSAAYQGGISSSVHFHERANRKYLREALKDLAEGKKVKTPFGRTLGCVITRGGKNAW